MMKSMESRKTAWRSTLYSTGPKIQISKRTVISPTFWPGVSHPSSMFRFMTPLVASLVPPDVPSTPPGSLEIAEEDPTTPKASTVLPQLTITQNDDMDESSLMPPPAIPRSRIKNNNTFAPTITTLPTQNRARQKVILAPGHSPLDWARLKSSGVDLRVGSSSYKTDLIANGYTLSSTCSPFRVKTPSTTKWCMDGNKW